MNSTLDVSGNTTLTGNVIANDDSSDNILLGQNGTTPDVVTVQGNVSIVDSQWNITQAGAGTFASLTDNTATLTAGNLTGLTGVSMASGNFSQIGTGTFGTGSGAVSLNGPTTLSNNLTVNGATTLGNGTGADTLTINTGTGTGAITTSDWAISTTGELTNITGITNTGAYTQTGTSANTFSGATTLNGTTTFNNITLVSGTNTFSVGTGATTLGGTLGVTGASTLTGNTGIGGTLTVTGVSNFNNNIIQSGAYTFSTGTGAVGLNGNTTIIGTISQTGAGAVDFTGNIDANAGLDVDAGNLTIASGGNLTMVSGTGDATLNDIVPAADSTYNLGAPGNEWANLFVDALQIASLTVSGTSTFNGVANFNTDANFTLAETENLAITNTVSGVNTLDLIQATLTNNTATGSQRILTLENASGAGTTEALISLNNADADTAVTDGLIITSANGLITDAIDVSDAEITNALNVGDNIILGTTATIDFSNFDVSSTGNTSIGGTLGVNSNTILTGDLTVNGSNIILGDANSDAIILNAYINDDLYLGANTETIANPGFVMNGNDLFVAGMAGIKGNVYTDGAFIAGAGTTTYGNGNITDSAALSVNSGGTGALTLDSASGTLVLGAGTNTLTNTDTTTALLINPTGNVQFKNSNNYITSTGDLTLAGDTSIGGATTLGDNLTFAGTTARTITGPTTGGLTTTVATGPLTLQTTTSGTLAVSSAGALNLTGASASTWNIGTANALTLTSANFRADSAGNVTIAAGQGLDTISAGILALGNTTATTVNLGTTATTTLNLGAGQALTRAINIGTGTGADTINIGTGATGSDVIAIGGGVGTLAINNNTTIAANKNLTMSSGTGVFSQTFNNTSATSPHSLTYTYSGIGGSPIGMQISATNSPITTADSLSLFKITATDTGILANTVKGLDIDVTTANPNDTTYAALFNGGNVGIGTIVPGVASTAGRTYLSIKGTTGMGVSEFLTSEGDGDNVSVGQIQFTDVNSIKADKRIAGIVGTLQGTTPTQRGGTLRFFTNLDGASENYAEKMRISNTGNIGIGTTNPIESRLVVSGTNSSTVDETLLTLKNTGENIGNIDYNNAFGTMVRLKGTKLGGGSSADEGVFTVETATNSVLSEKMRITSDGYVGIGTTIPGANLEVFNSANSTSVFRLSGVRNATGGHSARIEMFAPQSPAPADTKNFQIVNLNDAYGGGVGNILQFRQVNDANSSAKGILTINNNGASAGGVAIGEYAHNNNLLVNKPPSNGLIISGNVGIGTATPSSKLEVAGDTTLSSGYDLTLNSGNIVINRLSAPTSPSATPVTGGTLAVSTYYYKVTAVNNNGETLGSTEVSCTTDATNKSCQISWTAVTGAVSYKVYGRATGAQTMYWTSTASPLIDTGTAGTAGTVPTTNTTGGNITIAGDMNLNALTVSGTTSLNGGLNMDGSKFIVADGTGNTTIAGTLNVSGTGTSVINNTLQAGTLEVTAGDTTTRKIKPAGADAYDIGETGLRFNRVYANYLYGDGSNITGLPGGSLQGVYGGGNTITTTNAKDLEFNLADTATDSNFIVNITAGSTGKFEVQNAGIADSGFKIVSDQITAYDNFDATNGLDISGSALTTSSGFTLSAGTLSLPNNSITDAMVVDSLTLNTSSMVPSTIGTTFTLDVDNTGSGANVEIIAKQGTDADGTIRYNAGTNIWELKNNGGSYYQIATTATGTTTLQQAYNAGNTITATNAYGDLKTVLTDETTIPDPNFIVQIQGTGDSVFKVQAGATPADVFKVTKNLVVISQSLQANAGFSASGTITIPSITNETFTLDADNTGTGNQINIIAKQGSEGDGTIRYDTVNNVWQLSNNGGAFSQIATTDMGTTTLQQAYTNGNTVDMTDARNFKITLANTATDPNIYFDILDNSDSAFAVRYGTAAPLDVFKADRTSVAISQPLTNSSTTTLQQTLTVQAGISQTTSDSVSFAGLLNSNGGIAVDTSNFTVNGTTGWTKINVTDNTNTALLINQIGTANIVDVQDNGTSIFTIADAGVTTMAGATIFTKTGIALTVNSNAWIKGILDVDSTSTFGNTISLDGTNRIIQSSGADLNLKTINSASNIIFDSYGTAGESTIEAQDKFNANYGINITHRGLSSTVENTDGILPALKVTQSGTGDIVDFKDGTSSIFTIADGGNLVTNLNALGSNFWIKQIGNPTTAPSITAYDTGGNMTGASGTGTDYYYVYTATNTNGETVQSLQSAVAHINASVTTGRVELSWQQITGATGYKIYRTTSSGNYGASSLVATKTGGTSLTHTDTLASSTSGTPPTANTAGGSLNTSGIFSVGPESSQTNFTGDLQNKGGASDGWTKYRNITVTASTQQIDNGYQIKYEATGAIANEIYSGSLTATKGNDVRMIYRGVSSASSTLSAGINATVTTIPVTSTTNFPETGMIEIGTERIAYDGKDAGNLLNAFRGAGGTTATTHNSSDVVIYIQEMERKLGEFSTTKVQIFFKTRADISASASNDQYSVYYSNANAGTPPADIDALFTKNFGETGLLGLWHFDEGTGLPQDSSGSGNNATFNNATWIAEDGGQWDGQIDSKFTTGAHLDFTPAQQMMVADSSTLHLQAFTLSAWVRMDTTSIDDRTIISKQNGEALPSYIMYVNGTTRELMSLVAAGYSCTIVNSGIALTLGLRYHVTVTWDGTTLRTFVNAVSGNTSVGPRTITYSTDSLLFGRWRDGAFVPWDGQIDEVRIHNRVLTQPEIQAQYERRKYITTNDSIVVSASDVYTLSGTIMSSNTNTGVVYINSSDWDITGTGEMTGISGITNDGNYLQTGGYASFSVNSNTNSALTINQSGTSNLFNVQDSGTSRFLIADGGETTLAVSDTNTALTVNQSGTGNVLDIYAGTNKALTVINGGEVGVGIASPTADLNIKGNLNTALTGTVTTNGFNNTVSGSGTYFTTELVVGDGIKIGTEAFTVVTIFNNTTLVTSTIPGVYSSVIAYKDSALFLVQNGGGTERFKIDKSGNLSMAGAWTVTPGAGTNFNINLSGAGDFAVNTNQLYVDTSAANVGIGTTIPNGNLTIYKDNVLSATQGNLLLEHPTSGGASSIVFPSRVNYGSDYGSITYYDDNNTYNYWGDTNENSALVIGTQNDGQGTVSDVVVLKGVAANVFDSGINYFTGNIGIGDTTPASLLTVGNGDLFQVNSSGDIITATAENLSITTGTTGILTLDSGTTGAINIGTNANAKTITLGNSTGATAVNFNTGTAGSTFTTTNGAFNLNTGTGVINLGTDAVAKTIIMGNGTGATSLVLNAGTGNIDIGANAVARTINIGTGAAVVETINLGGTGANVIGIGTGTGADTINIGTGATGSDVIAIGGGVGTLAINTGDWDISTTGVMTGISGITNDGVYSQTGTGTFGVGTGTATFGGDLTVNGATTSLASTAISLTGSSPILNLTSATTLSINTTTNRPVTFGTGTVTIPNLAVTSGASYTSNLNPSVDNAYDLGTTTARWKTLHVGPGSVVVHNDATNTLKATLGFSGTTAQLVTDTNTALQLTTGTNTGLNISTTGAATFGGALTVTGATTLNDNLTFSGTTARTITGPTTGGLTTTVATGPLTLQTTTSGTLAVSSAGALNLTGASASTWNIGTANALTLTSANFRADSAGNVTIAAGQGLDTISAGILALGNTTATTVNLGTTATTTLNLGAGQALTRAINIGTGTGADTINIGTGATGSDVIAIGGGVGTLAINTGDWDISTTGVMTGISGITNDGVYSQTGTGTFGVGTGTATFGGDLTVNGATTSLASTAISLTGSSPILNLTSATTLSINTTTNRPVTFGTGTVTIPNLAVTSGASYTSNLNPSVDNAYDLGTTTARWKTLHVGPGSVVVHNDATNTLKATLGFSGTTAQLVTDTNTALQLTTGTNTGLNISTTGAATFGGALTVTGATTLNDNLTIATNKNLTMTSGSGVFSQTFNNTSATSPHSLTYTYSGIGGSPIGMQISATNSPITTADSLSLFKITATDTGTLANTVKGLDIDVTTANANDTTYAALFNGGNVGIGTTSPSQKLEVVSTIYGGESIPIQITNISSNLNSAATLGFRVINADTITGKITNTRVAPGDYSLYMGPYASFQAMTIRTSGKVGIGTTTPNEQLEITGNFRLPATTATTGIIKQGADTLLHTKGAGNVFLGINSGNLTTTSYSSTGVGKLSLSSLTSGFENTAIGYGVLGDNTTGYANTGVGHYSLKYNATGYNNTAIGKNAFYSNTTGSYNTAIGDNSLFNNKPISKAITAFANATDGITTVTSEDHTQTNGTTIQITGTTNYNGFYTVANATADTFDIEKVFAGTETGWWSIATQGRYNTAIGRTSGYNITTGSSNTFLGYGAGYTGQQLATADNSIAIGASTYTTASNQAMYGNSSMTQHIFQAGNVGIGTTNPSGLLHIARNNTGNDIPQGEIILSRYWASPTNTRASAMFDYFNSIAGKETLAFGVSTSLAPNQLSQIKMVIQDDGNVGIGTTTPSQKLDVVGNIQTQTLKINSGSNQIFTLAKSGTNELIIANDNTTDSYLEVGSNNLNTRAFNSYFRLWGAETGGWNNKLELGQINNSYGIIQATGNLALQSSGGNVGIGTTTPNSNLDVYSTAGGKIRLSGSNAYSYGEIRFSSSNGGYLNYGSSIEGTGEGMGMDIGDLRFKTGYGILPQERMRITGGGNVGIGATAPGAKLTVQQDGTSNIVDFKDGTTSVFTIADGGNVEITGDIISKGIKWTSRSTAGMNNGWNSVAYGNGLFVAVSEDLTNRVMTSPDGINWTNIATPVANSWVSVTYGNGLFVAVSWDGNFNQIMTSSNGINWTSRTTPVNNIWNSVTYGNGLFVAVSEDGSSNRVMTSPDGINWTIGSSIPERSWRSVTYGNGKFVAVSFSGTLDRVMYSSNGINWTIGVTPAGDYNWYSVTYGNGLFVAVAQSSTGNQVMYSQNGINWTNATTPAGIYNWNSVTYGNGLFVAVTQSSSSNQVMTSPNGTNWTLRATPANNFWSSVTYGNGLFVAVSYSGTDNRVMTSGKADLNIIATNNIYQGGIDVRGRIGMNTWTADGDVAVYKDDVTGNLGLIASDKRLKKNLIPLQDSLSKITKLQGYLYNSIDEPDDAKKRLGLIAQDVKEVLPEATFSFKNEQQEEYFSIHYEKLTALLVEGIKEQEKKLSKFEIDENGNLKFKTIKADKIITKEFEMIDQATGDVYCTWIENGEWIKNPGECSQ